MSFLSLFHNIFGEGRNINNVAIPNIFGTGRDIYWYGIIIAIGVVVAFIIAQRDVKRRKMPSDSAVDMVIWAMIPAIIGARLYYVIFDPSGRIDTFAEIINISGGGLAIYGGVIGGAIGLFLYSIVKKHKITTLFDIAAPCLAIGQAFGRWGNFMNQEAFGNPVTDPAMQWFPYAVYFNNPKDAMPGWFQATFFYESFWCLLICIFIIIYRKRQRFSGELALWYFALYGLERTFVELLRQDQLKIGGEAGVPVSSLLSAVLVVVSVTLLCIGYFYVKKGKIAPATPGSIYYIEPEDENGAEAQKNTNDTKISVLEKLRSVINNIKPKQDTNNKDNNTADEDEEDDI